MPEEYLDLVIRAVTNYLYLGERCDATDFPDRSKLYDASGWRVPPEARPLTGASYAQLRSLASMIRTIVEDAVCGDLVEAGVWRGGVGIVMAGALRAYGDRERTVWLADSFAGIPMDERDIVRNDPVTGWSERWEATREAVESNLHRFKLHSSVVRFVEGRFRETLPGPIESIALLRIDADCYSSTSDVLHGLYRHVNPGGFVVIDDWHLPGCRQAVLEFRRSQAIEAPFFGVHRTGSMGQLEEVYWRKPRDRG